MLSREQRRARFAGPISGVLTPFATDESVDLEALRRQTRFAVEKCGATAIMVVGGEIQEAPRLNPEEKLECIRVVVESSAGEVPVIAGTAETSTLGTVELASKAERLGADAIIVMPPRASIQEIVEFYRDVSRAVGLPMIAYNNTVSGIHLPPDALSRIFEEENVVGLEDMSLDYPTILTLCRKLSGNVSILTRSPIFLPALDSGGHGAIMPVPFSRIGAELFSAYGRGDRQRAFELQAMLCGIPPDEFSHGSVLPFYKEVLKQVGIGSGVARKPATRLDEGERSSIAGLMREWGLSGLDARAT